MADFNDIDFSFIENFEWNGRNGKAADGLFYSYDDGAGIDTIGVGHRNDYDNYQGITETAVRELFKRDVVSAYDRAVNYLGQDIVSGLSAEQLTAVVSFIYNSGSSPTLMSLIRDGKNDEADIFWRSHYVSSHGVSLSGLVTRRNAEADLFKKKSQN